ncbi:MAG: sulfate transporter CysZ [Deltaproteobacteria bacterium]|nr:sulfate transporter CysZ [Deltaproteobacteria bacterium]NIS77149.1 sulfate transporter CysZ [Deltaproteobacteria bacterium]
MIGDFLSGAGYFFQGLRIVRQKGVRPFVLMPLLVNFLVFAAAILIAIDQYGNLLGWLLPGGDSWWAEFARIALWIFFAAAALTVLFFTFTLVANVIGAPFNGLLSEKVELILAGAEGKEPAMSGGFFSTIIPSIASEFRKLSYFLVLAALLVLLTLVPLVNVVSPFLWFAFSSWMLAVEYLAYPMENHDIYFSQVKARLRQDRWAALGFGMGCLVVGMVPVVNFFIMPAAVAGATAMWVERLSRMGSENGR